MIAKERTSMKDIFKKDHRQNGFSRRAWLRNVDYQHFSHHQDCYGNECGLPQPGRSTQNMDRILDKVLEKSTTLYINYGEPITIGKGCFISSVIPSSDAAASRLAIKYSLIRRLT